MKCARHLWKEEGWQQRERGSEGRGGVEIDESLLKVLAVENNALKIIRPYNALERKKKKKEKRKGKSCCDSHCYDYDPPTRGHSSPSGSQQAYRKRSRTHICFFSPPPLHAVSNIPSEMSPDETRPARLASCIRFPCSDSLRPR